MNSNHLKIAAIVLAAFLIIIADLAFLGLFDNSKYYDTVYLFAPYFVFETAPGDYLRGDEVPYVIDYDNSSGEWTFRDADEWNAVRKTGFGGAYLISENMPPEFDTANQTRIPELNYSLNFRADDGILRYNLYYRSAMNAECIKAFSDITYTLSRQNVSDNLTREELKNIPEELIYGRNKSVEISNLPAYESICIEDTYDLPKPERNEIYYLRITYKAIESADVPGRTVPRYNYDPHTSVFVIKDSRTRFDSTYDEYTANKLETEKKRGTINDTRKQDTQ